MRFQKGSHEYSDNIFALHEMERVVPMTMPERSALRNWVTKGNDIETNTWHYVDSDGYELNYLQAYRIRYGYYSGPWDYWRGDTFNPLWDERDNCYRTIDERF